jgi:hypothetical protein
VASRGTLKGLVRTLLGTTEDDAAFPDATLDPILQQAADALVADLQVANPDVLVQPGVTLAADAPTSHTYSLATQSLPVTDFAGVVELRYTDETGLELEEARVSELRDFGADTYAVLGVDEAAQVLTSPDTTTGVPLWLRYRAWPAEMTEDASVPGGIPARFHDVIAFEALFAYGLGGEQRLPPELRQRWGDRRAQLFAHLAHRSTLPRRTRLVAQG